MIKQLLIDRWAIHLDAYTMNRYRLIRPFLRSGDILSLNVGTGGGVETLRLLRRGNRVTILEIDTNTAAKTSARIENNGYGNRFKCLTGHFMKVQVPDQFEQVMMCEVLEHIKDDEGTIRKLAAITQTGAQLILSTPTASYGQMLGDEVVADEDPAHPEYHVRAGYDGPELDKLLTEAGFKVNQRILNGYLLTQYYHLLERWLRSTQVLLPLAIIMGVAGRLITPLLELVRTKPSNQITIATRV